MKRPDSGLVALTVGMVGSAAANTAWTWDHGPVRIVAGLFATALVPTSLHLWHRVPVTGRWTRAIRAVVMTYICLAAAVVNLMHASWLLVEGGEDGVLAVLLVTALEAVMVMASLARRAHPKQAKARRPAPAAAPVGRPVERVEPGAPAAVEAPAEEDPELVRARQLVAENRQGGRRYGRGLLARDLGCSADRARQLLAKIDADRPVQLVEATG